MPTPISKAKRYAPVAAATASEAAHQVRTNIRGLLLYFLPFPLLIGAITALVMGKVTSTLLLGGAFAAYMLAATIARRGFKLEAEYQRRKIARAPKTPFKTVAAIFASATTGVLAWLGADYGIVASVMMDGCCNFLSICPLLRS